MLTLSIFLAVAALVAALVVARLTSPGAASRRVARRRLAGVGPLVTRDGLDLAVDLATLDGPALNTYAGQLSARISAPEQGDDVPAMTARATEVVAAINDWNSRRAAADAARAALASARAAGAPVVQHAANGGGADPAPVVEVDETRRALSPELIVRSILDSPDLAALRATGRGRLGAVTEGEVRALFATGNYPSQPTRVPGVQQPNRDTPLTILDLIDRQTISTNTVEWVQEVTAPGGAAEVAEGSAKPESTFSLELKQDSTATIAHWVNITRQALDDERQLEGYIRGRLSYGLFKRLNAQVLNGNGTAPNLRGILQTTGIGTYVSAAGASKLISIRKAKTVAQLSEYEPDAVVLHPTDWEGVELDEDDNGAFRAVQSVARGADPTVWGLAVVVTTNIAAGTFLVGGFREGATLWERTGVQTFITDSHASNFTSNILTLLMEMRAALSVWRPKAFVKGTFTPAA